MIAFRAARFLAYWATSLRRFSSRLIRASFAMIASILVRELDSLQQSLGFCVGFRGGGDADVHTPQSIDLVVLDFRENDLFLDAHIVVTLAIKTLARDTTEVTHTRQSDGNQTIQELEHARTTQGDHATDRIAITNLEAGDRLTSLRGDRLLAGDLLHVANGVFQNFLISNRLTNTHVQGDLGNTGHFHNGLVTELLGQIGNYGVLVKLLQTRHDHSLCVHQFAVRLEHANLAAIFEHLDADTIGLLGSCVEQRNIGDMNRHVLVHDATSHTLHRVRPNVLFRTINTFDNNMVSINTAHDSTALTLVLASNYDDFVALANLFHHAPLTELPEPGTRSS